MSGAQESDKTLVVVGDGDDAVRKSIRFVLEVEGFRVKTHGHGAELLADTDLPGARCLMLCEELPLMEDFRLIALLRRAGHAMPVILLICRDSEKLRRQAAQAGIARMMEKPFIDNTLVENLVAVCGPPAGPGRGLRGTT